MSFQYTAENLTITLLLPLLLLQDLYGVYDFKLLWPVDPAEHIHFLTVIYKWKQITFCILDFKMYLKDLRIIRN